MIIPETIALLLFYLIPIIMYVLTIMIVKYSEKDSDSRLKRWFYLARTPIRLESLSDDTIKQIPEEGKSPYIRKEILLRLCVVYLVIGLFLLSNIIGTFYHVMADALLPMGQGSTGDMRTWSAIVLTTPFSGGWTGTFPWYGYGFWPPAYIDAYNEPWNWIFHLAALSDNPGFFDGVAPYLFLIPLLLGVVLLLPLAKRSIRESFLPSFFHLHISMMVIMSSFFNCFAEAFALQVLASSITYGQYTVDAGDLNGLPLTMLITLIPILILAFAFFIGISYKIGKKQYGDSKKAQWLYVSNTAVFYWLSLLLAIVV